MAKANLNADLDEVQWVERYRPHKIADCILPIELKNTFENFVKSGSVPNLILNGSAGRGKTTVAKAMLDEMGCPYLVENGSLSTNMDKLRNQVAEFASSFSLTGKRKYVIIDEADWMNHHVQPALRAFTEQFSRTCGFIFTCNYKNRMMIELHSRTAVIDFTMPKKEAPELAKQMFKRVTEILRNENVEFDTQVVGALIKKHFPDFRRTINELQAYAVRTNGKIDTGILSTYDAAAFKGLIQLIKEKDFTNIRKWVVDNEADETDFYRRLYDNCTEILNKDSIPPLVLLIAKYQYQSAFAADKQINLLAFLVEAMVELEFR